MRTTALVVEAGLPLDNAWGTVPLSRVSILVEGSDPVHLAGSFRLDGEHWLVPGMNVPVSLEDSGRTGFEIDWEAVPGIDERVAANDPSLADPAAAQERVAAALQSAGIAGADRSGLPQGIVQVLAAGEAAREGATPDRLEEALQRAARTPAPAGRLRALVLIATRTMSARQARAGAWEYETHGRRKAVLAVTVPGRGPYAVLDRELDIPQLREDVSGAGIPATVSASDPRDVEVLWDELAPVMGQVAERISDKVGAAIGQIGAEEAAFQQMLAGSGVQQQMADSAKQVLAAITDPAQRRMMINQYRAAGIEINEEDLST